MTTHGASSSLEIERKYEVLGDEPLPRIELPGAVSVAEVRTQMIASYWDTPARDLGRAGIALRSRIGGGDAGWHLKERGAEGVRELHWPIADELPDGARAALRERLGHPVDTVAPVATVRTDRTVRRLLDASGRLLVELADDHVLATDHDGAGSATAVERAWREWEAELGEGADPALLDLVELDLLAAGARLSLSEAKIQRTLGQTVPAAWRRGAQLPELLACALADLADRIAAASDAVRADEPDAVHRARILVRRARDLITTFWDDLGVSSEEAKPASGALQALNALLDSVRDAEVRAALAERLLATQPAAPGLRRVRRLLVDAALTERAAALAELRERIEPDEHATEDGQEPALPLPLVAGHLRALAYAAVRQDLATAAARGAQPSAGGQDPAPSVVIATRIDALLEGIGGAAAQLADLSSDSAADSFAGSVGADSLHRLRTQARCIRTAVDELGEAAGATPPLPGPLAAALARSARTVQDLLGDVRDAAVLAHHLDLLADSAPADGIAPVASTELATRLAARVHAEAAAQLAEAPSAIARLQAHRLGA